MLDTVLVLEQVAKGTMGAVRLANKTMLSMAKAATIISMADDLIEPTSALRDALIRAVIACLTSDQDVIVSLGVPSDTQDPRYGHAIYNPQNTIIPQVYHVDRFVEKPKEPLHLLENECFSWEGGCVITKSYYLQELLRKPQHPDLAEREDISYGLLENPQVHKGTALFSPKVRFMDFGVPDDNLREFFLGSDADRGNGNIVLGPSNSEVVFIGAMRNLVVSDRLSVEVIGISDHLIIDNSYTNSAVVIPLEKVDELPTLYRMLENPQNLHPYIAGGESAWKALPHHITYECQGHCEITSSYGLAFAAYSTNLRMTRGEHGLKVVDTSFTNLTDFDIDILMKKKSDPRLIQHLIDVTVIAEALADSVNLSPEGKELLHRLCLLHDYGGFLDDEHLQAEKEIILMMQNVSGLDWRVIDPQVMKKLVLINSETSLTEIQQRVLTKFNDSINSALEALDIPDIRSYKYLNELLFCLCNHDRPDMFRRPYTSKFTMLLADLESVIACCVIADIWAKTHSLWKYQLRDHELTQKKEDIGGTAAFICNYLTRAGLDPAIWIRHLNRLMLNASTPLFYYTCNKLRILVRWQGLTEQVPLYGSDNVYLAFTACDRGSHQLDDKVRQAIELALVSGENFDKKLLLRLPANLSKLAEYGVVNRSLVEDLAQEIMSQFRQRERRLWEEDEEGRSSLLQVLNQ